jgi:hypothetical protein
MEEREWKDNILLGKKGAFYSSPTTHIIDIVVLGGRIFQPK